MRKISPHVLRHTKAMHLLRAGVNMIYIRDFLGHVDISTTEVYARIDAEMKRKVFEEKVLILHQTLLCLGRRTKIYYNG